MSLLSSSAFKAPVIGTDPVTRGTFVIEYAYMTFDKYGLENGEIYQTGVRCNGKIVITSANNNPLYKIAKEQPLRLQGLVASVNFGTEKRFIRFEIISDYTIYPEMDGIEEIILNPVTFEILDNLEYLENVEEYKNWNLL
jgi:hypothetical protein